MANRILGMGDVLPLIDKVAEANHDMDAGKEKEEVCLKTESLILKITWEYE